MISKTLRLLALLAIALPAAAAPAKHEFAIGEENFTLDGNKLVIRCGECTALASRRSTGVTG